MRLTSVYRPAVGVVVAGLLLLASLLILDRSVGADPPTPTVTPVVSGPDGQDGWKTGPVHLAWDIAVPKGQIDSTSPECNDADLIADTGPTTITCVVALKDGETAQASVVIKIDGTAPTVTCPSPPVFGRGAADAQLSAAVADATSGAPTRVSVPVDASAAGDFTVPVSATDAAGNTATVACGYSVVSDATAPTVSVESVTGDTGEDGWYIGDVAVVFSYGDDETPIVSAQGCNPPPLTTDTAGTDITCTAVSGGGSASASVTLRRDATPPVISCPAAPEVVQGNSVTVVATISDATSGPTATSASAVGDEYALGQHTVTIAGSDLAGNAAQAQCAYTVIADPAAPVVTPVVVGPSADGSDAGADQLPAAGTPAAPEWYTGDVAVRFTIDAGSPLIATSGCAPQTITQDTPGTTISCTATSSGGTTTTSVTIARDTTPPTVSCPAQTPVFVNGAAGQFAAAFADATSGVSADSATLDADTAQIGLHSVAVSATDQAGNVTDSQCDYQVIPDRSPPVVQATVDGASGADGWYTGPVTVTFSVSEDDSPITSVSGCDVQTIDQDTAGTTIGCSATSFGGTTVQSVVIKRDTVGPTVTCLPVDFVQGSPGRVAASTQDHISGVTSTSVFAPANTYTLGARSVMLSSADQAGNITRVQCDYDVLAAASVKAARLSHTGQNIVPPLLIASFLVVMGGCGLALTARRRAWSARHGAAGEGIDS